MTAPPYDPRLLDSSFYEDPNNQAGLVSHWTPGGFTTGDFPLPPPPPPPRLESWPEFLSRQGQSAASNVGSIWHNASSGVRNLAQRTSNYESSVVECNGPCDPSTHAPPPVFRRGSTIEASSVPISHQNDHHGNGTSCCGASHNPNGVSYYGLNRQQQQPRSSFASQPATPVFTAGAGDYQRYRPDSFASQSQQYPQGGSQYSYHPQSHGQLSAPYQQSSGFPSVQPPFQPSGWDPRMTNQGFNPWQLDTNESSYAQSHQAPVYSQLPLGGSYVPQSRPVSFVVSYANPQGLTHGSTPYQSSVPHYGNANPYSVGWTSGIRV